MGKLISLCLVLASVFFVSDAFSAEKTDKKEKPKCKKSDPGAKMVFGVEEKLNPVDRGDVIVPPLSVGKGLLVSEAIGTLKLFDEKGALTKRVDLGSGIFIQPFLAEGKLVVLAGKKIYFLSPTDLQKLNEGDLPEDAFAAGVAGSQAVGVSTRSGKILVYGLTGAPKGEMSGIFANPKFPAFFYAGGYSAVVGQNSVRFFKPKKENIDFEDLPFKSAVSKASANEDLLAVAEESGALHLIDMNTKKDKVHNLDGKIDAIVPNEKGVLVSTFSGTLYYFDSVNDKAPKQLDIKATSGGLTFNEKQGIFALSSDSEVYSIKGKTASKTGVKSSTDFFSLSRKEHVTFQSGYLRVVDSDGTIKLEHKVDNPGKFRLSRLGTNTFMVVSNPIRALTIAENLTCP
jgi:hypothetical protein